MTTQYRLIFWRDIPAQVKAKNGRGRCAQELPPRFRAAIYRAAYRARAINGDAFTEAWRASRWQPHAGDPNQVVADLVAQLEEEYPDARLDALARNRGHEPSPQ